MIDKESEKSLKECIKLRKGLYVNTCKYCTKQFKTVEELQMHEINCKCNPYYHMHEIDKNNYVYPVHTEEKREYEQT